MSFSIGLIEVSSLGHAITIVDDMLKAADVEFVATERKLGGRLVTLVVKGSVSSVEASIEAGKQMAEQLGCLKAAEVIARPHPEIFQFLHLDDVEKKDKPVKKEAVKPEVKAEVKPAEKKTVKSASKKTAEAPVKEETKAETKNSSKAVEKTASDKKAPVKRGRKPKQS